MPDFTPVPKSPIGFSIIGDDRPEQRERLPELRDFFDFPRAEYGEEHVRRWEEYHVEVVPRVRQATMGDRPAAVRSCWSSLLGGWAQRVAVRRTPIGRMRCSHAAARKADSDPPR
ncbi:hypothetical protein [Plantactinospora sp. KLBMP9567]|uniref:hypothetical protein n=1 Tax=Plantactinospora sp. KLBMP9567 TaxID=3085900 RepID=UPI002980F1C4|nr:hypothetical protein [Plantactinospora sp. KLBMP9567]MDW5329589.1 hypothetical protein [Plantactinospora sp. KLBMP9567]